MMNFANDSSMASAFNTEKQENIAAIGAGGREQVQECSECVCVCVVNRGHAQ